MSQSYTLEITGFNQLETVHTAVVALADYLPSMVILDYSDATKIVKIQMRGWAVDALIKFMNDFDLKLIRFVACEPRNTLA
jgi:hypothetical protein